MPGDLAGTSGSQPTSTTTANDVEAISGQRTDIDEYRYRCRRDIGNYDHRGGDDHHGDSSGLDNDHNPAFHHSGLLGLPDRADKARFAPLERTRTGVVRLYRGSNVLCTKAQFWRW